MPAWIPYAREMVYLSGVAEIMGGLGLLVPRLRTAAALGLIGLLVAVFPANVQMLINAIHDHSTSAYKALLWLRLPLQPLLILWIYRTTMQSHSQREAPLTSL